MTRTNVNIATVYSSAQCVLSVVGSVGVILLFAGIPQLIYAPVVSVANLLTFLLGAILITTMVAGNSYLNYKYRRFEREARERRRANGSTTTTTTADPEDKPPSYDAILSLDGLPPDYYTVLSEKPPRYEDIAGGLNASPSSTSSSSDSSPDSITCESSPPTEATTIPSIEITSGSQIQADHQLKTITLESVVVHSSTQRSSDKEDERKIKPEGEENEGARDADEAQEISTEDKTIDSEGKNSRNPADTTHENTRQISQDPVTHLNESET